MLLVYVERRSKMFKLVRLCSTVLLSELQTYNWVSSKWERSQSSKLIGITIFEAIIMYTLLGLGVAAPEFPPICGFYTDATIHSVGPAPQDFDLIS